MNERIRELALQAELAELYDRYVEYCMKNADDDIMDYDTIVKKFAELIVQEAMAVTKTYTSNQGLDYSAPVALARHFGVGQ